MAGAGAGAQSYNSAGAGAGAGDEKPEFAQHYDIIEYRDNFLDNNREMIFLISPNPIGRPSPAVHTYFNK